MIVSYKTWNGVVASFKLTFYIVSSRILKRSSSPFPPLFSEPRDPDEAPSASDVAFDERTWVKRGRNSAVIVTLAWIAWVVIVQVMATDLFPVSWFVRTPDQGEYTGW
jgi:hypothetical protein